jgi:LSD1 subclass zinc finger protein
MALDPLLCPGCSAPVPLVAGDRATCPSCGASYPIPDTYQALRDEANANARKPEARALAKALGKPPPLVIRAFAMFSSPWFVMLGLGFWIAAGITVSALAMPWIGRHFFHVNTYDVLSEARKMQLMMVVPIGTLVIGFALTSWARKRGMVRGGLQSALAASPPARPGGPKVCHRCAAPLAPEPGALTARCAYCQADNFVEMPHGWVVQMRAQAKRLEKEVDRAHHAWVRERRALRRGLLIRFGLWTAFLLVPIWFIFGAVSDNTEKYASLAYEHAAQPPTELPAWRDELKGRSVDLFKCDHAGDGYQYSPTCAGGSCAIHVLVPLRHGEVIHHQSSNLPNGSIVELQMHDEQWLDDGWLTVARAPLSAGQDAATRVPYSGWYRLRVTVPGGDHASRWYCATVKPAG